MGASDFLEYWFRAKQPDYRKQMVFFAHANQELVRQAKAKNLAGVEKHINEKHENWFARNGEWYTLSENLYRAYLAIGDAIRTGHLRRPPVADGGLPGMPSGRSIGTAIVRQRA